MKNRGLIVGITAILVVIVGAVLLLFYDDIRDGVLAKGDGGEEATTEAATEDTAEARGHIFMTYSELKTNEYFFAYNCHEKAKAAVKSGKYETVLDYIYDTDFDHDALSKAYEAVEAGKSSSVLDYMSKHEDAGKMAFLLYFDPMYASAWGCYLDQKGVSGDNPILYAEKDLPVPQQPDAATQRFLENSEEWDAAIARISSYIWSKDATSEVKELLDYTSGMYAVKDGITEGIPAVIVANTTNAGGHFIVITLNGVELKFRLECGYQPIEIPNWEPSITTVPDNPKKYQKDPADDPLNGKGAEDSDANAPDPKNYENDETETPDPKPEENNPGHYDPPEPPTEAPTEEPTTEGTKVDPSSDSGSTIVDDTNGKTEKSDTGKDATVQAGDGQDHGDFNKIVKDPEKRNTTEEQFKNETTYDEDFTAPE
ncbi:hypothetical protein IKG50_01485 [Candidatus Saccharibacteria bacterium]|nr:hypothetical protein [Candidatus Saccharibacteria bacterium]